MEGNIFRKKNMLKKFYERETSYFRRIFVEKKYIGAKIFAKISHWPNFALKL